MNKDIDWKPPRCQHGNIILGCPFDDCQEQNEFLAKQHQAVAAYYDWQEKETKRVVRELLGLQP